MKDISFLENKGVDIKQALDIFGDAQTYNETIGEFLVGIHTKINQLIEMMNNADMNNYSITVHSLKSDAKYFGFTKLADLAIIDVGILVTEKLTILTHGLKLTDPL